MLSRTESEYLFPCSFSPPVGGGRAAQKCEKCDSQFQRENDVLRPLHFKVGKRLILQTTKKRTEGELNQACSLSRPAAWKGAG